MDFHNWPLPAAIDAPTYRNSPALAETQAGLMNTDWPGRLPPDGNLGFVPRAADRAWQRGFNPSEGVVRHLGQMWPLPHQPGILHRMRNTPPPVGLNTSRRRQNMWDAFAADSEQVREQDFILIGDMCTTGATLGACVKALLEGGARLVWAPTLARAPFTDADLLNQEAFA